MPWFSHLHAFLKLSKLFHWSWFISSQSVLQKSVLFCHTILSHPIRKQYNFLCTYMCTVSADCKEKLLKFCKFKHDLKDSVLVQYNFKLAFEWVCNCELIFQTEASAHCYAYNATVSFSGRHYSSFKQTSLARLGIWSTLCWTPPPLQKCESFFLVYTLKHILVKRYFFALFSNIICHSYFTTMTTDPPEGGGTTIKKFSLHFWMNWSMFWTK